MHAWPRRSSRAPSEFSTGPAQTQSASPCAGHCIVILSFWAVAETAATHRQLWAAALNLGGGMAGTAHGGKAGHTIRHPCHEHVFGTRSSQPCCYETRHLKLRACMPPHGQRPPLAAPAAWRGGGALVWRTCTCIPAGRRELRVGSRFGTTLLPRLPHQHIQMQRWQINWDPPWAGPSSSTWPCS